MFCEVLLQSTTTTARTQFLAACSAIESQPTYTHPPRTVLRSFDPRGRERLLRSETDLLTVFLSEVFRAHGWMGTGFFVFGRKKTLLRGGYDGAARS